MTLVKPGESGWNSHRQRWPAGWRHSTNSSGWNAVTVLVMRYRTPNIFMFVEDLDPTVMSAGALFPFRWRGLRATQSPGAPVKVAVVALLLVGLRSREFRSHTGATGQPDCWAQ